MKNNITGLKAQIQTINQMKERSNKSLRPSINNIKQKSSDNLQMINLNQKENVNENEGNNKGDTGNDMKNEDFEKELNGVYL